jgi:hypothetical protein
LVSLDSLGKFSPPKQETGPALNQLASNQPSANFGAFSTASPATGFGAFNGAASAKAPTSFQAGQGMPTQNNAWGNQQAATNGNDLLL